MPRREPSTRRIAIPASFAGAFRITEMNLWPMELFDHSSSFYVRICRNGTGHFAFALHRGDLVGWMEQKQGVDCFRFRWEGIDEDMPVDGAGVATATGSTLLITFAERGGQEIKCTATRVKSVPRQPPSGRFKVW